MNTQLKAVTHIRLSVLIGFFVCVCVVGVCAPRGGERLQYACNYELQTVSEAPAARASGWMLMCSGC